MQLSFGTRTIGRGVGWLVALAAAAVAALALAAVANAADTLKIEDTTGEWTDHPPGTVELSWVIHDTDTTSATADSTGIDYYKIRYSDNSIADLVSEPPTDIGAVTDTTYTDTLCFSAATPPVAIVCTKTYRVGNLGVSGKTYYFQVDGYEDGEAAGGTADDASDDVVVATGQVTVVVSPAIVSGLEASPGSGRVTLKWNASSDAGITGYQVRYRSGTGADATDFAAVATEPHSGWDATATPATEGWVGIGKPGVSSGKMSYTIHGLESRADGSTYQFQVRAVSGSKQSPVGAADSTDTTGSTAYANPGDTGAYAEWPTVDFKAEAGDRQVTLTWDSVAARPTDAAESDRHSYQLTYKHPLKAAVTRTVGYQSTSRTTYVVTGLENGVTYTFTLKLRLGSSLVDDQDPGEAEHVAPITETPSASAAGTLGAVVDLAVSVTGKTEVQLTWEAPARADSSTVYQVEQWYRGGTWVNAVPVGDAVTGNTDATAKKSVKITGLTEGREYSFRVRVESDAGNTPWSVVTATPSEDAVEVPAKLAGVTAVAGDKSVTISWDTPSEAGITQFDIRQQSQDGLRWGVARKFAEGNAIGGVQAGLVNGTSYTFQVRAVNSKGAGPWSESVTATAGEIPAPADTTAPETTITDGPEATTEGQIASFEFTSSEEGSTFECALNGSAFSVCGSPWQYSEADYGRNVFQVRAVDGAGNTDPSPASWVWTAVKSDTTAPSTTIEALIPAVVMTDDGMILTNATSATFVLEADEAGVTFHCSLDGEAFAPCESSPVVRYSDLATGMHTFSAMAMDAAGNAGEMVSQTWSVTSANLVGCTIIGTEGDDNLVGTSGDDVICGLGGNDVINGRGGNDEIRGGAGGDVINGGAGDDTIRGGSGNDRINGNAGDDTIRGDAGVDTIRGGKGDDTIYGGAGDDTIYGDRGADMIVGGPGNDSAVVGEGDRVRGIENRL